MERDGKHRGGQLGGALTLALLALVIVAACGTAVALASASGAQRDRATERALAQARDALIAYAADRPIDAAVGPGYLPCPDGDDDGWAEPVCGSLSGHLGQEERLGRLPWKTLGLPDMRDGHGERLWYAVSARHKGLLNCAASPACVDMTPPAAAGTITLRSPTGAPLHDGTRPEPSPTGGAAAVVIAPGAPITRLDAHVQRRDCPPGECDARGRCLADPPRRAARCDPRNYLDRSAVEDNADFRDRTDSGGRPANSNGFIAGPVLADGRVVVNDRVIPVPHHELMARVMARVAIEAAHCVRLHAAAQANVIAAPEARCAANPHAGAIADEALSAPGCNAAPDVGWWAAWKPHVLHARAAAGGLAVLDERGQAVATGRRFAVLVTRGASECGEARLTCAADGCTAARRAPTTPGSFDALVASP